MGWPDGPKPPRMRPGEATTISPPVIACATCAHWLKMSDIVDQGATVGAVGYCRRNAPRISIIGSRQLDPWPTTPDTEVCGGFETPQQFNRRASR